MKARPSRKAPQVRFYKRHSGGVDVGKVCGRRWKNRFHGTRWDEWPAGVWHCLACCGKGRKEGAVYAGAGMTTGEVDMTHYAHPGIGPRLRCGKIVGGRSIGYLP